MPDWLSTGAIIVLLLVAVIMRRLRGEPLNARDLLAPPLVLTGIGGWTLLHTGGLTVADHAWSVAGCVLGIALGAARGQAVDVHVREGVLWQRYTGRTFAYVLGSLLLMAGFTLLAAQLGMNAEARPTTLAIGVSFLGEALAIGRQALSLRAPFAPGT